MLGRLSLRNVRRQLRDYSLYFITLSCSVSFLYAFHALLFSESVKTLSELEVLPYMIVASSLLIIIILGWMISYMTNYMLKKRSRELSIYMVSGVSNRIIGSLVFHENLMIGGIAFLMGLPAGILLSQLLEAALLNLFGLKYSIKFFFSFSTAGLTFLFFAAMFLHSLLRNRKWLRKTNLYDLLSLDRQNEQRLFGSKIPAAGVFLVSIILCAAGLMILLIQPLGKGFDLLAGMIMLILFLFGFFFTIPAFLTARFENNNVWKYRKDRLVTFRVFTSKIRSMSMSMSILSVLFLLAITFFGIGTAASMLANRSIELNPFDVMILHNGEMQYFSRYEGSIRQNTAIQDSCTYGIYTGEGNDFLSVCKSAAADKGWPVSFSYKEFQADTYLKQSDYAYLRKMLGYEDVELKADTFYIHCVPALAQDFTEYLVQNEKFGFELGGYTLTAGGVYSEPLSQSDAYGNGLYYVIVIPDHIADHMPVLYSLYAAVTESPLDRSELQNITGSSEVLDLLNRNVVRTTDKGAGSERAGTSLVKANVDYLSGRWVQKDTLSQLFSLLVCLFYLALILEITGAAILGTQLMSDGDKKKQQDNILRQLGMSEKMIARLNRRQLLLLFLLPILPALIIGGSLICFGAGRMQSGMFPVPIFSNGLWIFQAFGSSLVFFALLYGIYYMAAQSSYSRSQPN